MTNFGRALCVVHRVTEVAPGGVVESRLMASSARAVVRAVPFVNPQERWKQERHLGERYPFFRGVLASIANGSGRVQAPCQAAHASVSPTRVVHVRSERLAIVATSRACTAGDSASLR